MPDMNYIHQELKRRKKTKVTLYLLWEEYRLDNPDGYGYTQFRVYYRKFKKKLNPSMRQTHLAGEKLFVDYSGLVMPIYNQRTGEIDTAQIFVAYWVQVVTPLFMLHILKNKKTSYTPM